MKSGHNAHRDMSYGCVVSFSFCFVFFLYFVWLPLVFGLCPLCGLPCLVVLSFDLTICPTCVVLFPSSRFFFVCAFASFPLPLCQGKCYKGVRTHKRTNKMKLRPGKATKGRGAKWHAPGAKWHGRTKRRVQSGTRRVQFAPAAGD